jgi:methyl-accepting chemotaxis protein
MLKHLRLATKMSFGFGILVVISGALGYVGWSGLSHVTATAELAEKGNECMQGRDLCAQYRRDFALSGFEKANNEDKNAADKWQDASSKLQDQLQTLARANGLRATDRAIVNETLTTMRPYRTTLGQMLEARKARDEAYKNWVTAGGEIVAVAGGLVTNVIKPSQQTAQLARDVNEIVKWNDIGTKLDEVLLQEFLLLRVKANHLIATSHEDQWKAYQQQFEKVKANLAIWTEAAKGDAKLETVTTHLADLIANYDRAGQQFNAGLQAQRAATAEANTTAKALLDSMTHLQTSLRDQMQAVTARTNVLMLTMAISGVVLGIVMAVLITLSIIKPIRRIIDALAAGSEQVSAASGQVSAASQSLAEGATEQAAGLEETSSSLEEMASMTRKNAENAQEANGLASDATKSAHTGSESMNRMNAAIKEIQKSSDETSKIIKVIDEIAFQTNLLALNAAVEAARAGEAGKGFAVVAEEVRNLAMRSAEAAKNTSHMIEESVKNAKNGVDIAAEVGKVLNEIVQSVSKTTDLVGEIAAASQEQSQGIDQVNTAVAQMDKVTQQNAANAEESASASEELGAQAEGMKDVVNQLVALVGGATRKKETHRLHVNTEHVVAKAKKASAKTRSFGKSDDVLYKIAGHPQAKRAVAAAAKDASFDTGDRDLERFNS